MSSVANTITQPPGTQTGAQTGSQTGSGTGAGSGSGTGGSGTGSGTGGTGGGSSTTSINQQAPAGGLIMTQPPQTASASYYKIAQNDFITFGWNFTYLLVQPTSLTVQAICGANGFTYPVGGASGDGVIPGTATSVVWDPYGYEQSPGVQRLAAESYTLRIMDERGATALGTPGMFNAYSGLKFALYKPKDPTPLSGEILDFDS
ncbi:hypothetical protein FRC02_002419 [Tulasnella sp. 418]|nr:hypothetical protein FRC02_002419 [Tulasnella sp. 418]